MCPQIGSGCLIFIFHIFYWVPLISWRLWQTALPSSNPATMIIYIQIPPHSRRERMQMQPLQRLFIRGDRQKIYLHFPNRHKFRHQPKPWLPICEWRPKFQILPLGRAIHNGATFSMFSNEFSRWKSSAGANTVAQSSSCFTSYNWPAIQERRLFPSQKNWVCPFGKTRFIPGGKTGFNRQQMGINAGKAGSSSIFAALLTFSKIFGPKSFSCGS